MSEQVIALPTHFSRLRPRAKLGRIYRHLRGVLKNIATAAPPNGGNKDGDNFEVVYDSGVTVIREHTRNGGADRMTRPIKQDPVSWQAGYKVGLEEITDNFHLFVPPGADEVSFYSGLIKGRSDRDDATSV